MKKILIVEDDINVQNVYRHFLEAKGYKVITASNGEVAIEQIGIQPEIDLILTDFAMPVMDGVALLNHPETTEGDTPIIVLSNMADVVDQEAINNKNVKEYLVKIHTTLHQIGEKVEAALK